MRKIYSLGNISLLTAVAAVMIVSTAVQAEEWGTLKGKFIYDGKAPEPKVLKCNVEINKDQATCCAVPHVDDSLVVDKDGGLANVFVWVRSKPKAIHPAYAAELANPVKVSNKNCQFVPHGFGVRVGQKVEFSNPDNVLHNAQAKEFNLSIQPDKSIEGAPKKPDVVTPQKVSCSVHPWMTAYMLVRPDPYFAVTGPDGSFEIKNLPVGEHELAFWHEKTGYVATVKVNGKSESWSKGRKKLKVEAGDNDLGEIKVPASSFK